MSKTGTCHLWPLCSPRTPEPALRQYPVVCGAKRVGAETVERGQAANYGLTPTLWQLRGVSQWSLTFTPSSLPELWGRVGLSHPFISPRPGSNRCPQASSSKELFNLATLNLQTDSQIPTQVTSPHHKWLEGMERLVAESAVHPLPPHCTVCQSLGAEHLTIAS